jgi:hypothetical protein
MRISANSSGLQSGRISARDGIDALLNYLDVWDLFDLACSAIIPEISIGWR